MTTLEQDMPVGASARAIDKRRRELRGGRSVRQVSRDQHDLDNMAGERRKVRNRKSWARHPTRLAERITS